MKCVLPVNDTASRPRVHRGWLALALVAALVLITGIDRFIIRMDSTNFRVELLIGGVGLLSAVFLLGREAWRAIGVVEYGLIAWLIVNLLSSSIFSPDPQDSLKQCILLTGLLVIYFAMRLPLRYRESVFWGALLWVGIGSGVVLLGLVQGVLFTIFGVTTGMHFNRSYVDGVFSAIPMVTGTVWEPNLFGSYSLAVGLVAAGLAFAPQLASKAWQWRLHVATAIGFAGVIVSMTRTVWLAAVLMALLLVVLGNRLVAGRGWLRFNRSLALSVLSVGMGVALGLVIALSLPKISWATEDPGALTLVEVAQRAGMGVRGEPITGADVGTQVQHDSALADRAGELASVDQVPSLLIRQEVMVNSFKGWLQRPLLGWGTGAYSHVFVIAPGAPNWIPNIFMHVLFDTGLTGFVLFCGSLGFAVWRAIASIRKPTSSWTTSDFATFGLLLATLALLLTYQLTDGTWMGFTWVILALVAAAGQRNSRGSEDVA